MITISCDWGADLSVGPNGDIAVAPVQSNVQQRIVRRLLTNPGDYIWHIDYGAGLGGYVGQPFSSGQIEDLILSQLQLEALIATSPTPAVHINPTSAGAFSASSVTVQYQVVGTPDQDLVVVAPGAA